MSLILPGEIGKDILIKRFLRGISKIRPQKQKYNITWDPQILLQYLEKLYPNNEISLELLTKKLVTLLAIVTGHRIQTLSLIKVENIIFSSDGKVTVFISDPIKTSGPGVDQPCLQFQKFYDKPEVCIVQTLNDYINKTISIRREDEQYLFLSFVRPHNRASSQTLSRWIKQTMSEAGINTKLFTGYSTRHASTSSVFKSGVSLNIIRKTAGWTSRSMTFAKFYNKPVVDPNIYAHTILNKVF